jgi:hypothetical protein
MCHVLSAEKLLALLLKARPEVSYSELRKVRNSLGKVNRDLILDVSAPSIALALAYYPSVFARKDRTHIGRANTNLFSAESTYLKDEFLSDVPRGISKQVEQALASA